jgi:hypothetical protein
MKSYIVKLLIFILPILVLIFPIDFFLSQNLKKSKTFVSGEYMVWNDIYNGRINEDIVIYGASRAMVNFDPEIIEDSLKRTCYDLGINGLGFWHIYLRHREFLKYNKPPKYIIFSIDISSLVRDKNLYNEDQFLPYMLGNDNIRRYTSKVNKFSFFDFYIPLVRFFGRRNAINCALKCSISEENIIPERTKGYMGMNLKWNDDFDNARKKLGCFKINIDSTSIALFNDFLSECKAKNINLIIVYSPEYIDGQKFVKDRERIINIYSEYAKKNNIPFLDYSDDEMCYEKKYYYNASHLNKAGSELFTKKLIRDLKNTDLRQSICLSEGTK